MNINYIYNAKGKPEYAVIPFSLWKKLSGKLDNKLNDKKVQDMKIFDPKEYRGVLTHLNLNIEDEILEMRNDWTRNIL